MIHRFMSSRQPRRMRQRTPRTSSDTCVGTLMSLDEGPTRQLPPNLASRGTLPRHRELLLPASFGASHRRTRRVLMNR